jgi:hypothetical protein
LLIRIEPSHHEGTCHSSSAITLQVKNQEAFGAAES